MEYGENILPISDQIHFEDVSGKHKNNILVDRIPGQIVDNSRQLQFSKKSENEFIIQKLNIDDTQKILDFLGRFFFRGEPMNVAINLLENEDSRCPPIEDYATSSLTEGVSFGAVDSNGELVGVVLNGISHSDDDIDWDNKIEQCPDPKFQAILRVLHHLDTNCNVWKKYPERKEIMEIRIAATHSSWRGRGVMKELVEATETLCRKLGVGMIRIDTTSKYSAAAARRLNYTEIYSVSYKEMEKFVPRPSPPHTDLSVFIKKL